jgi:hypothetical protein
MEKVMLRALTSVILSLALGLAAANVAAQAPIVSSVVAQGVGKDPELAAKNAAENALTQVVGQFIDSEKQISKRAEIVDGIRSETKNIDTKTRAYSQGSIKSFEILNIETRDGLTYLTAQVGVRVEDFRAYVKRIAEGKTEFGGGIFAQISSAAQNEKSAEEIIFKRLIPPIKDGQVLKIDVGAPKALSDAPSWVPEWLQGNTRCIASTRAIALPVRIALTADFRENLLRTFDNLAAEKFEESSSKSCDSGKNLCLQFLDKNSYGKANITTFRTKLPPQETIPEVRELENRREAQMFVQFNGESNKALTDISIPFGRYRGGASCIKQGQSISAVLVQEFSRDSIEPTASKRLVRPARVRQGFSLVNVIRFEDSIEFYLVLELSEELLKETKSLTVRYKE